MKVYVVEKGCYDEGHIAGVYSSLEKAMAAHPAREPNAGAVAALAAYKAGTGPVPSTIERPGGWIKHEDSETWSNGLDWGDAADIRAYELDEWMNNRNSPLSGETPH